MSTSGTLAHHFLIHPCFRCEDISNDGGYAAQYVHHFISTKQSWPEDFRVHINFIPTTFETYIEFSGCPESQNADSSSLDSNGILEALRTAQGEFPGGFVPSRSVFVSLIHRLESFLPSPQAAPKAKRARAGTTGEAEAWSAQESLSRAQLPVPYAPLPGNVIAACNVDFNDDTGENIVWLAECSVPVESSSEGGFAMVHRRIEWFMHFYIDALSPIELEARWRLIVPFRMFSDPSPLECLRQVKPKIKDDNNKVEVGSRGAGGFTTTDKSITNSHLLNQIIQRPNQPFEILGLVTIYQFFAMPKDRARISQFFLFPHRHGKGIGRASLAAIFEILAADPNIRQITVEDPSPAFQRIRDLVSIDRAIERKLFCPKMFYPDETKDYLTEWQEYSKVLSEILFEPPSQRHRIKLLLLLGAHIPVELTKGHLMHFSGQVLKGKKCSRIDRENNDKALSSQIGTTVQDVDAYITDHSPALLQLRIREKRRLRLDSYEWYTQPGKTQAEIHQELTQEWRTVLFGLLNSLRTIRSQYPRDK